MLNSTRRSSELDKTKVIVVCVRPSADYQWVAYEYLCALTFKIASAIGVRGSYGPAFSRAVSASTNRESASSVRNVRSDP
eukprot:3005978-Pyramimonas_sp.AAC.1